MDDWRVNNKELSWLAELVADEEGETQRADFILDLRDARAQLEAVTKERDECKERVERAEALAAVQDEYIEAAKSAHEGVNALAYVHGWRASNDDIETGKRLRAEIAALKTEPAPSEEEN